MNLVVSIGAAFILVVVRGESCRMAAFAEVGSFLRDRGQPPFSAETVPLTDP